MNCTDNTTYIPGQKKITPTGTIGITENGTYDVAQYASADVNVSGGGGDDSVLNALIDRSITRIAIPNDITKIGDYAFRGCTELSNVSIPSTISKIGDGAFYGCASLESIDIPSNINAIKNYTFSNCTSLMNITVRATTPPQLGQWGLQNVPSNANIYVPAESVNAYKAASIWSGRAAYIQAISE